MLAELAANFGKSSFLRVVQLETLEISRRKQVDGLVKRGNEAREVAIAVRVREGRCVSRLRCMTRALFLFGFELFPSPALPEPVHMALRG